MKKILRDNPYIYYDPLSTGAVTFKNYFSKPNYWFNWYYVIDSIDGASTDIFKYMNKKLIEMARNHQGLIVFNWETEGFNPFKYFKVIKHNCDLYSIPYTSIIYVTSNLLDPVNCSNYFKKSHNKFMILPYLHFIMKNKRMLHREHDWQDNININVYWKTFVNDFSNTYNNKIYSNLSRRNRIHRVYANYILSKSDIFDYGLLSQDNLDELTTIELREKVFSVSNESREDIESDIRQWNSTLPYTLDRTDFNENWGVDCPGKTVFNSEISNQVLFQIINETLIDDYSIFISEKTANSIVNFEPFVIYGNRYINKTLKDYGFLLFEELFDYSFDAVENPYLRFQALIKMITPIVHKLQNLSRKEKMNVRLSLRDKLVHNFKLLATYDPTTSKLQ